MNATPHKGARFVIGLIFVGLIIIAGALLRWVHLATDLPFIYNPDEPVFVSKAIRLLQAQTLDPGWYGHPGQFTIYMLALSFSILYFIWSLIGEVDGPATFFAWFNYDPTVFYLISRIISAAFSTGCLFLVALITRRLARSWVTVALAVLLVAINPLLVEYGFYVRTDNQFAFFALLVCFFSIRITETADRRDYLLSGAALGLALSCKYPAIIFAVAIITAHLITHDPPWHRWGDLLLSGFAALTATFLTAPYLFLNPEGMIRDLLLENISYKLGHTVEGPLTSSLWYFENVLRNTAGYIGLALFVIGLGIVIWRPNKGRRVLAVTAVTFFIFIVNLHLVWTRWLIPFVPLYVILIALTLDDLAHWTLQSKSSAIAISILSLALLAHPGLATVRALNAEQHDLTKGSKWILCNVPQGSHVLLEQYTPQLPASSYELWKVSSGGKLIPLTGEQKFVRSTGIVGNIRELAEVTRKGIDFLVLSSEYYPKMKKEPARYRTEIRRYEELLRTYPTVYKNKKLRVLQVKGARIGGGTTSCAASP